MRLTIFIIGFLTSSFTLAGPSTEFSTKIEGHIQSGPFGVESFRSGDSFYFILGSPERNVHAHTFKYKILSSINPFDKSDKSLIKDMVFGGRKNRPKTYSKAKKFCRSLSKDELSFRLPTLKEFHTFHKTLDIKRWLLNEKTKSADDENLKSLWNKISFAAFSPQGETGAQFKYYWIEPDEKSLKESYNHGLYTAANIFHKTSTLQSIQKPLNYFCIADYITKTVPTSISSSNQKPEAHGG